MKRLGWGILAFIVSLTCSVPASALETVPTAPNKITGPLLVAGYSFSGSNLRYVQLFNNSSNLVSLDGWQVTTTTKTAPFATTSYVTLSGLLEPGKHVIAALPGIVDRPSFIFPFMPANSTPIVGAIALLPPASLGYNDESVSVPTITSTTAKEVDGSNTNYYVKRELSATTGNYLSGFAFILPTEKLKNDQLYVSPQSPLLQIVEVYPDAKACSPFEASALCGDYIKLFNASSSPIDLSMYRLRTGTYGQSASSSNTRTMNGTVPAGQYVWFPISLSSSGSWVWLEDTYGTARFDQTAVEYPSSSGHSNEAWAYDVVSGGWRWTTLPSASNSPNTFPVLPPVNQCSGVRLNEIAANVATEDQFIELYNPTVSDIDLTGCVLQTNRSKTAIYTFSQTQLASGSYTTVYIKDTSLTLTKTTSGTVYMLSSDLLTEVDTVAYANLNETTSWMNLEGVWMQSYVVTPNAENSYQQYPTCEDGYYRNAETGNCNKQAANESTLADCGPGKYRSPDTNRCRSLEALATALTPCDEGQYRNPETNRCRSLVSTASILVPCAANQERNPETNRCRAIGSSSDLKPCAENQERNPDTNRCRNKTSNTTADFPVEAVAQSGQATLGWWAFGGVGTLAAGYAGWEWRREVISWIRRILPFGIGRT